MNIAIPTIHRGAGYALASALRPHCDHLIAIASQGRPAFSRSKLYDARYVLPPPRDQWIGGSGDTVTEEQASYLNAIIDICRHERADVAWPTNDADLFLFTRARERFEAVGTRIATPSYATLVAANDKSRAYHAARSVGFPVPDAIKVDTIAALHAALSRFTYPMIVKGRWSTNSRSVYVARSDKEALALGARLLSEQNEVILQRYLTGKREVSLHYLVDQMGEVRLSFALRKIRHVAPSYSTAIEIVEDPPELRAGGTLLQHIGMTGFCVIQTREDSANGALSLMEINCRFGTNSRILFRLCPDLVPAALSVLMARPLGPLPNPTVGSIGVSPVEDVLSLWSYFLCRVLSRGGRSGALPTASDVLSCFAKFYRAKPVIDIHTRALWSDFIATIPYFLGLLRMLVPSRRRLALLELIAWEAAAKWPDQSAVSRASAGIR